MDGSSIPQVSGKRRHRYHLVTVKSARRLQLFAAITLTVGIYAWLVSSIG
jgi:hypothetical protein